MSSLNQGTGTARGRPAVSSTKVRLADVRYPGDPIRSAFLTTGVASQGYQAHRKVSPIPLVLPQCPTKCWRSNRACFATRSLKNLLAQESSGFAQWSVELWQLLFRVLHCCQGGRNCVMTRS